MFIVAQEARARTTAASTAVTRTAEAAVPLGVIMVPSLSSRAMKHRRLRVALPAFVRLCGRVRMAIMRHGPTDRDLRHDAAGREQAAVCRSLHGGPGPAGASACAARCRRDRGGFSVRFHGGGGVREARL